MPQKRGLGRGLDALLSSTQTATATSTKLPIKQIQPGQFQPRQHFDEEKLRELADSINTQGMIQPIVVRAIDDQGYEIIAGERRWRAAQLAGHTEVPVIIKTIDDQTAMALALIENMQRDDLKPLEEATAIQRLLNECNLTHQQVAESIGKSRATVSNLLRLLDLEPEVRNLLEQGALDMGHARALLGLTGEAQHQAALQVVKKQLTVRATETLVRQQLKGETVTEAKPEHTTQDYTEQLKQITEQLGMTIRLQPAKKDPTQGKLVIQYTDPEQLATLLAHIQS